MVVERRARAGRRLGGAVALEHGHAEVLPRLLERGRQERARADEQPEPAAEPLVDAPEDHAAQAHRQPSGDAAEPRELARPARLLHLAFDGAPEQVEHLGDDDHRGDAVLAQRFEDHARVDAAQVEDVGADVEGVEQPDRLLEQVRQRQQRDDAVVHPRDDRVEGLDARDDVVVGEHHALRRPGRPRGEDQLPDLVRTGPLPGRQLRLPVGRERVVRVGRERVDGRRREPFQLRVARIGGVPSRAEDELLRGGLPDDVLDRVGRHAQVQRDEDQPRPHRPEVHGREGRGGRRPGQQPVARLQPERAQAPRRQPAAPVELAEAPVPGRAVVGAEPYRVPIAEAGDGRFEEIEERVHCARA